MGCHTCGTICLVVQINPERSCAARRDISCFPFKIVAMACLSAQESCKTLLRKTRIQARRELYFMCVCRLCKERPKARPKSMIVRSRDCETRHALSEYHTTAKMHTHAWRVQARNLANEYVIHTHISAVEFSFSIKRIKAPNCLCRPSADDFLPNR